MVWMFSDAMARYLYLCLWVVEVLCIEIPGVGVLCPPVGVYGFEFIHSRSGRKHCQHLELWLYRFQIPIYN